MHNRNATFLQDIVNSCYENGLLALKRGEIDRAKKLFYSAAENALLLAKELSGETRRRMIQRSDEIVAFAEAIEARFIEIPKKEDEEQYSTKAQDEVEIPHSTFATSSATELTFDDVVGLEDVKEEIRRLAIYPREHPEIYEKFRKNVCFMHLAF